MNLKRNYHYILSLNLALISFVVESVRWFLTSLHGNKTKSTVAYNTTTRWHHKTALECRLQTIAEKILSAIYYIILYIIYRIISYHIISYIMLYEHVSSTDLLSEIRKVDVLNVLNFYCALR